MPRPKPPAPLKARYVRLSDLEWEKFKEMGGAEWLRKTLKARPTRYYDVFLKPSTGEPHAIRKQTTAL